MRFARLSRKKREVATAHSPFITCMAIFKTEPISLPDGTLPVIYNCIIYAE